MIGRFTAVLGTAILETVFLRWYLYKDIDQPCIASQDMSHHILFKTINRDEVIYNESNEHLNLKLSLITQNTPTKFNWRYSLNQITEMTVRLKALKCKEIHVINENKRIIEIWKLGR